LSRFRHAAVLLLKTAAPPLFHPKFVVFPLDYIADVWASRCKDPELIMHVITFKVSQLIWPHISAMSQTDGRFTMALPHDASCTLHDKKCFDTIAWATGSSTDPTSLVVRGMD